MSSVITTCDCISLYCPYLAARCSSVLVCIALPITGNTVCYTEILLAAIKITQTYSRNRLLLPVMQHRHPVRSSQPATVQTITDTNDA